MTINYKFNGEFFDYEIEDDEDMTDEKFAEMMNTYLANQAKQAVAYCLMNCTQVKFQLID